MLNDSFIIDYSINSLENGEISLSKKNKYYKPNSEPAPNIHQRNKRTSRSTASLAGLSQTSSSTLFTNHKSITEKKTSWWFIKRECKTLFCFICFLVKFKFHSTKCYLIILCLIALFTQMIQGG